jgi:hypothetical protein
MDHPERSQRLREARRRLGARRRRAGLLRGRVVAASLIGFAVLWGIVFAQMATGNDPVLGGRRAPLAARASEAGGGAAEAEPAEVESVEAEPETEFIEVEPEAETLEAEPEAEFFEPEPEPESFELESIETAQS